MNTHRIYPTMVGLRTEVITEKDNVEGEIRGLFGTASLTDRRMPLGSPRKPADAFK
jgi:hypothetical protein